MFPRYLVDFNSKDMPVEVRDVIVVGSGIAGLTTALELSKELDVLLVAKAALDETATKYAQGGIAAAISPDDSPELHLKDTLEAGAGLCDRAAVDLLVNEAGGWIGELMRFGAEFDWLDDRIRLAREGGHSLARVIHTGDATGSEIEATLIRVARRWDTLAIYENTFAIDVVTVEGRCVGLLLLAPDGLKLELAPAVILASGGMGQLFEVTTNPAVTTGDGPAMAYRAGATLTDMEFVQFHPTALDYEETPRFLITEALRGEGALLRDSNGDRFMVRAHPLAELAPRDVVTREIMQAMERTGERRVYLDATHISAEFLSKRFPTIYRRCLERGFDLAVDLLPVAPAAHFAIGGVRTDVYGRSDLPGLFATGEAAATGVHGANRLASNSLLEGLVFSKRIAAVVKASSPDEETKEKLAGLDISFESRKERLTGMDVSLNKHRLQKMMMEEAGPVRSAAGLIRAIDEIERMTPLFDRETSGFAGYELKNMIIVSSMIVRSALEREESRGVHYRIDFPDEDSAWVLRLDWNAASEVGMIRD